MQKMNIRLIPYTKANSILMTDLNIKYNIIKLLENRKYSGSKLAKVFSDLKPKHNVTKCNKLIFIKIKYLALKLLVQQRTDM